jgi:hypothetical protein
MNHELCGYFRTSFIRDPCAFSKKKDRKAFMLKRNSIESGLLNRQHVQALSSSKKYYSIPTWSKKSFAIIMIIGESDQRLSENSYYESPQKFEVLKRKFSNKNENAGENLSTFSDRPVSSSFDNKSSDKMSYVENVISEHYQTYQATEIHQDGEQSYINLTVLTPTLVQYDKIQSNHHQQMTNFTSNTQLRDEQKSSSIASTTNKYEARNYQQQQAGKK